MNPFQKLSILHKTGQIEKFKHFLSTLNDYIEQTVFTRYAIDEIIGIELSLYTQVAKLSDDEGHVKLVMDRIQNLVSETGLRYRVDSNVFNGSNVSLIFHSPSLLAHAAVVQWFLDDSINRKRFGREFYVIVMNGGPNPAFSTVFEKLDCKVIYIDQLMSASEISIDKAHYKLELLRDLHRSEQIICSIWISASPSAAFFFSARYASVQIYWTMKFHHFSSAGVDGYVSCGSEGQHSKRVLDQEWFCRRIGFASNTVRTLNEIDIIRNRLGSGVVILGTFARSEKIAQHPFLNVVADILQCHPNAHFIWTGHTQDERVTDFFRAKDLLNQTHYIGWINTAKCISSLDVFLETLPFGCGQTASESCSSGVPLVSMDGWSNFFGMHLFPLFSKGTDSLTPSEKTFLDSFNFDDAIGAVSTIEEYKSVVSRLIEDPGLRKRWGEACKHFYSGIIEAYPIYESSFYSLFDSIIEEKNTCQS